MHTKLGLHEVNEFFHLLRASRPLDTCINILGVLAKHGHIDQITRLGIHDLTSGFRAYNRAAIAALLLVLTLIIVIFRSYRSKHRINMMLEGKTRELTIGAKERIGADGEVVTALDEAALAALDRALDEVQTFMATQDAANSEE